MGADDVPVLDVGGAGFPERLREVAHDTGVCYLTGHEVPSGLVHEVFTAARRFFALPEEAKAQVDKVHSPRFRGFTARGVN